MRVELDENFLDQFSGILVKMEYFLNKVLIRISNKHKIIGHQST